VADRMVEEAGVHLMLHWLFVTPILDRDHRFRSHQGDVARAIGQPYSRMYPSIRLTGGRPRPRRSSEKGPRRPRRPGKHAFNSPLGRGLRANSGGALRFGGPAASHAKKHAFASPSKARARSLKLHCRPRYLYSIQELTNCPRSNEPTKSARFGVWVSSPLVAR